MEMIAEEESVNRILNELNHDFKLKPNLKLYVEVGINLKDSKFKQLLELTLDGFKKTLATKIDKNEYQIKPDGMYVIGYYQKNQKNEMAFLFPYGANIANLLSNTVIKEPRNPNWSNQKINDQLNRIFNESVTHIVMQELFKYYIPDDQNKEIEIPKSVLDTINYAGLKTNDFNLIISFRLPLNDLYRPLRELIKQKQPKTDYQKASLAPIHYAAFDKKTNIVSILTALR